MLALRTKYHFGGISSSSEGAHLSGKILEYTFKPTKSGPLTILNLGDYSLQIQIEGHDESVAYASIVSVRLVKESGKNYKLFLYPDGRAPVAIQNYSFSDGGAPLDQSGAYALFVRVLHHHLKDKSHAIFTSGSGLSRLWQWTGISAVFSLMISLVADYLGFTLINPYIQAMFLTAMIVTMVLALGREKLSKAYEPTNIPLQFLP